ncbi:transposase [Salmonella enterica subsp. enterica serovar Newport]|nr:transposase [Salmonella enterica subsp. enterica serovar Newport]
MSTKRYSEQFKIEAVKQVVECGNSVFRVATSLDITTHSLRAWIKKFSEDSTNRRKLSDAQVQKDTEFLNTK